MLSATKICCVCVEEKPRSEFPGKRARGACKMCTNARQKALRRTLEGRAAMSEINRKCSLKRKYGLTVENYKRMFAEQGGVCAICGLPESKVRQGQVLPLMVDHAHDTGRVRGLLCHQCNFGIGQFADNPVALRRAADYVEEHA